MNGGIIGKRRFTVIIIALFLWGGVEVGTQLMGYGGMSANAYMALLGILATYFVPDAVKSFAKVKE